MPWAKTDDGGDDARPAPVSHTGVVLSRATTFRFELDLTVEQDRTCWMFAGARRYTFNHHIGRVKANLVQVSRPRQSPSPARQTPRPHRTTAQPYRPPGVA